MTEYYLESFGNLLLLKDGPSRWGKNPLRVIHMHHKITVYTLILNSFFKSNLNTPNKTRKMNNKMPKIPSWNLIVLCNAFLIFLFCQ